MLFFVHDCKNWDIIDNSQRLFINMRKIQIIKIKKINNKIKYQMRKEIDQLSTEKKYSEKKKCKKGQV